MIIYLYIAIWFGLSPIFRATIKYNEKILKTEMRWGA
jgi:hypothetical protein